MGYEAIVGKPVRFPPGRCQIHLNQRHRRAYRALYARYQSILGGLPVLREHDFDGRPVTVTGTELEALNRAFGSMVAGPGQPETAFSSQENARNRLFKRLQYLS
jgi:hypothetical protein